MNLDFSDKIKANMDMGGKYSADYDKNEIDAGQMRYGGQKRSDLKDSDFLFPDTRSFPIVTTRDVADAISNFGRMKGDMSYETFLRKLYDFAKKKGPEFVKAFPMASKERLGIKE
jgi:hypothetical protein